MINTLDKLDDVIILIVLPVQFIVHSSMTSCLPRTDRGYLVANSQTHARATQARGKYVRLRKYCTFRSVEVAENWEEEGEGVGYLQVVKAAVVEASAHSAVTTCMLGVSSPMV